MHMTINILNYALSRKDAIDKASTILVQLTEDDHIFDYYRLYSTHKAISQIGTKAIKQAMNWTKNSFIAHLAKIRTALSKYTDNELYEQDSSTSPEMFKYHCGSAGQYRGSNIWMYDDDGEGIRDPKHLDNVLNKWPDLTNSRVDPKSTVWVTQADVHY